MMSSKSRGDNMVYDEIIKEIKENTPRSSGYTIGALVLIIKEFREMNEHLKKIADKHIDSGVI